MTLGLGPCLGDFSSWFDWEVTLIALGLPVLFDQILSLT